MRGYFLDTSFLLDLMKEREVAIELHEEIKGREVTGTPCVYELSKFAQFDARDLFRHNQILRFNLQDAVEAGKIYRGLQRKGNSIGEVDNVIAGMTRNRDLVLVTRDKDFKSVEGLELKTYKL